GEPLAPPALSEVKAWLLEHLEDHYALYGEFTGVRSARKHIGWAVRPLPGGEALRERVNALQDARAQIEAVTAFFDALAARHPRLPAADDEARQVAA
ncbi:MAG TPA: tRNA-dihydrouridine synthase, partial [Rubrivivax sp.]|nr:tRNA-dihydrouridine synthase [Rubrivivax sp.]